MALRLDVRFPVCGQCCAGTGGRTAEAVLEHDKSTWIRILSGLSAASTSVAWMPSRRKAKPLERPFLQLVVGFSDSPLALARRFGGGHYEAE